VAEVPEVDLGVAEVAAVADIAGAAEDVLPEELLEEEDEPPPDEDPPEEDPPPEEEVVPPVQVADVEGVTVTVTAAAPAAGP